VLGKCRKPVHTVEVSLSPDAAIKYKDTLNTNDIPYTVIESNLERYIINDAVFGYSHNF
jgi:hypothetical protein